jgi:hypothetical protein
MNQTGALCPFYIGVLGNEGCRNGLATVYPQLLQTLGTSKVSTIKPTRVPGNQLYSVVVILSIYFLALQTKVGTSFNLRICNS